MNTPFTTAVIGCGSIAQHLHLPGYQRRADVAEIIAVDPDPRRLAEVRESFGITKTYTDYLAMFATERPQFVSVCSPNLYHAEQAIAALDSGAHVFIEKPMTLTLDEAESVRAAAHDAHRAVMVGFSHRFMWHNRRVKALLDAGTIGQPFMIRVRLAHNGPFPGWAKSNWFYNPMLAGGGALLDMGVHAIDLCQWFVGPITSVVAQMGTLRKPIAVDDNAILAVQFGQRALGYIEVGWTSGPGFLGVEIYGDNGTIINDYNDALRVCTGASTPDLNAGQDMQWEAISPEPGPDGWRVEMNHFIDYHPRRRHL